MNKQTIQKFGLVFVVLCMSLSSAFAVELTLDRALELAVTNNQTIKTAQLELEQTKNNLNVKSWLPTFSAKATVSESVNLLEKNYWIPTVSISPSVKWTFSTSDILNKTTDELTLMKAQLKYQTTVYNAEKTVMTSYVNLISLANTVQQAESSVSKAEITYNNSLEMYEESKISELSLLQAKISYQNSIVSLDSAKTKYETGLESFRILIGLDSDTSIEVSAMPDLENLNISMLDVIADERLDETLDLKSAKINLELAKANEKTGKINAVAPSATFTTNFGYTGTGAYDKNKKYGYSNGLSVSGTLSVEIPINSYLPWTKENATIKNNELSTEMAEVAYENAKRTAKNNIDSTISSLKQSYSKVNNLKEHLLMTEENLKLVNEAYEAGYTSFYELNTARTSYLDSQSNFLKNDVEILTELCQFASYVEIDLNSLLECLK